MWVAEGGGEEGPAQKEAGDGEQTVCSRAVQGLTLSIAFQKASRPEGRALAAAKPQTTRTGTLLK